MRSRKANRSKFPDQFAELFSVEKVKFLDLRRVFRAVQSSAVTVFAEQFELRTPTTFGSSERKKVNIKSAEFESKVI